MNLIIFQGKNMWDITDFSFFSGLITIIGSIFSVIGILYILVSILSKKVGGIFKGAFYLIIGITILAITGDLSINLEDLFGSFPELPPPGDGWR